MSIFSARTSTSVTTTSSILKKSSIKNKLKSLATNGSPNKVRFVLPHAHKVQEILREFLSHNYSKEYESLVCLIRDAEIFDQDLSQLLVEVTECISLLNEDLRIFVDALLSVQWLDREVQVVAQYQTFIVNLVSAHNYHARFVIDKLVKLFLPDIKEEPWPNGVPRDEDCMKCSHIHSLLNILLKVAPICRELLLKACCNYFPYKTKSLHSHEYYLHNLLWILDYHPAFRQDIFHLIFSKLVFIDVSTPRSEIAQFDESSDVFDMEVEPNEVVKTLAETLDTCLDRLFNYLIAECYNLETGELDWTKSKSLYHDVLAIFDNVILPTFAIHHVQFVVFVLCSFKVTLAEGFLNYLWKKICEPNVARVLRESAVNYMASFVARAAYLPLGLVKGTLQEMADWIHKYISSQDSLESVNSDLRVHSVFYNICQALFYIIVFRHRDLVDTKKNILFLESLNVSKMITCSLNPLRVCQPAIVQNFAVITRKYQIAYCNTIIEHNARTAVPTLYVSGKGSILVSDLKLDNCFPFDPYVLPKSGSKISGLYRDYKESDQDATYTPPEATTSYDVVDDFLEEPLQENAKISTSLRKFSYGSSPGFKFKY